MFCFGFLEATLESNFIKLILADFERFIILYFCFTYDEFKK